MFVLLIGNDLANISLVGIYHSLTKLKHALKQILDTDTVVIRGYGVDKYVNFNGYPHDFETYSTNFTD